MGCTFKPAINFQSHINGLQEMCKNMVMPFQSPLVYLNLLIPVKNGGVLSIIFSVKTPLADVS